MKTITERFAAEQMFDGVSSPEKMGTTGRLAAWVYAGGSFAGVWNRYRRARSIIRRRLGEVPATRFAGACKTMTTNRWYREQIDRYERTLAKKDTKAEAA